MTTVYVPLDTVAVALDANVVADQLSQAGATVIRNGSHGLASVSYTHLTLPTKA